VSDPRFCGTCIHYKPGCGVVANECRDPQRDIPVTLTEKATPACYHYERLSYGSNKEKSHVTR
jgi:hypothetical protein